MLTLCSACIGQIPSDDRWTLLPDSTIGNFKHKHLAKLTGTRVGLEVKRRECLWEIAKLNDIVSTYAAKSVSDSIAIAAKVKESGLCAERLTIVQKQADRVPKLLPWARVGKWGTVGVGIGAALIVYQALKP